MGAPAGRYRHRVTIQAATDANNAYGEPLQTWANEASRWARVTDIAGLETWRGQKVEAGATAGVEMRYYPGLSPKKRLVTQDGRTLGILSALNPDGRKIEHVLQCKAQPVTLLDGLMGHWRLDETSGTRVDAHGANDLTDNNAVGQAAGKLNNAASFGAASSQYLSRADNPELSAGDLDFSVAAWCYLASKGADRGIVAKGDAILATNREYALYFDNAADRLVFGVGNLADFGNVTASTFGSPPLSTWFLVIAWHDAGANKLRVSINNGKVDEADYASGSFNGTRAFEIGRLFGSVGSAYWDGRLDSVSFWKRALGPDDRRVLWNDGAGRDYAFWG